MGAGYAFNLVDRILDVEGDRVIRAVKNLTLGEEYLADHFPTFPVMPGVLMLQTLVEAGAWLLRLTDDFRTASSCCARPGTSSTAPSWSRAGKWL